MDIRLDHVSGMPSQTLFPVGVQNNVQAGGLTGCVNGEVPALVTDDRLLPESSVIMEYLEDKFPEPAMRPADIDERATMNLFYRSKLQELYLEQLRGNVLPIPS